MLITGLLFTSNIATACEYKNHNIKLTAEDNAQYQLACNGSIDAIKFFESIGYTSTKFNVDLAVHDAVLVPIINTNTNEPTGEFIQVFGQYNAKTNKGEITSLTSDYITSRDAWLTDPNDLHSGVPIDDAVWQSVVTHEVAHQVLQQLWEEIGPGKTLMSNGVFLGNGVHEYVAYVAQLTMIDSNVRNKIIASYGNVSPLQWPESMNAIRHFSHPHKYGVSSYLTSNIDWIHDIINGKIVTYEVAM